MQVDFTKLEFPHLPAREKREEELKLYKKTQEDAMRTANSVDVSDRQPIFLKDKGDALYAQGNFHAAVNAYSIAIEKDEEDSHLSMLCRYDATLPVDIAFRFVWVFFHRHHEKMCTFSQHLNVPQIS